MVGATTMSLHGWKQMAEWSLEYSCLSKEEIKRALEIFKKDWEEFCTWVIDTYGAHADALDIEV